MIVGEDHVTEGDRNRFDHFVTESSTIGLGPGQWLDALETTLGNGKPLVQGLAEVENRELIAVNYIQPGSGLILRVFND